MRRIELLLLCCLAFTALPAAAKDRVEWILRPSFPPANIESGPFAGQGVIDVQVDWLLAHLKMFDNVLIKGTVQRALHEMSIRDGQCLVSVFSTPERRQVALFSRIAFLKLPPGLLVRSDRLSLFGPARNSDGAVELDKLARVSGLFAAAARDRSFGPEIDRFLARDGIDRTLVATATQAMKMLDGGRIDYTFAYAEESRFYQQTVNPVPHFTFLPVAGGPKALRAYIACSKGPVGQAVIREVDRLLEETGYPPPYAAKGARWLSREEVAFVLEAANWQEER